MIILRESRFKVGQVHLRLDLEDIAFYAGREWHIVKPQRGIPALRCKETRANFARLLLNAPATHYVKFKNGDPFDFTRANLEVVPFGSDKVGRPYVVSRNGFGRVPSISIKRKECFTAKRGTFVKTLVRARFSCQRREYFKEVWAEKHGFAGACRIALAWRVEIIRKNGLRPPAELLALLDRAKRLSRAKAGFEDLYGGNADYENSKVVAREVAHWAQPYEEAA